MKCEWTTVVKMTNKHESLNLYEMTKAKEICIYDNLSQLCTSTEESWIAEKQRLMSTSESIDAEQLITSICDCRKRALLVNDEDAEIGCCNEAELRQEWTDSEALTHTS